MQFPIHRPTLRHLLLRPLIAFFLHRQVPRRSRRPSAGGLTGGPGHLPPLGLPAAGLVDSRGDLLSRLLLDRTATRLFSGVLLCLGALVDVHHDHVAAEVHHLAIGDERRVVVPGHLTCRNNETQVQ